ncbi:MAG: S46 family peptidase [Bacteroidota bacterium]
MKKLLAGFLACVLLWGSARADEGMWLPLLIKRLNYTDMQAKGLQLTADEIYSVNNSSLKDAIVSLGGFCTAEVISKDGLLLTNHHCGFEAVQSHSSTDHDYLTDGFWARSRSEELQNEGLTAAFLVRMEDVTNKVLGEITSGMSEEERTAKIQAVMQKLSKEASNGTTYNANVREFFNGNEYYLFVYETFKDVRLVGAPPQSIGKFGGDTDNWMWPRHTGDFSLLRVYTDKDGKPAAYNKDNVPLKAKYALPVSISGVNQGDYAMIMGYPGSTDRYMTSYGVQQELDLHQPNVVKIRDLKLAIMREDMNADPKIRIMYASAYAQVANYWKYYIGQQKQLKRNKVFEQKALLENNFINWVNADPARKAKYGQALTMIREGVEAENKTVVSQTYLLEAGLQGPASLLFAFRMGRGLGPVMNDPAMLKSAMPKLEKQIEDHFKDFNLSTDKKLYAALLELYSKNVKANELPPFFENTVNKKFKGDFKAYAEKAYATSIFVNEARLKAFLAKPDQKVLDKDLVFQAATDLYNSYIAMVQNPAPAVEKMEEGKRLFVAGLREMNPNKKYYPDANSTMRLTYGNVLDYSGADAVKYDFITTLDGVMEKEDPSNDEFVVPAKLKELWAKKDYGRYADSKGRLITCFLTNNDITGGNSGSPVMNARGELIGTAFDGNWEAMSGDIAFEQNVQRTIVCDIRYVLFIIDKYAGAQNLINEMNIVTTPVKTADIVPVTEPVKPVAPVKAQKVSSKRG